MAKKHIQFCIGGILIALFFIPDLTWGDCLACCEFAGIELSLKSKEQYTGYICWNEIGLYEFEQKYFSEKPPPFPGNWLAYLQHQQDVESPSLTVYLKLQQIRYPEPLLVTTTSDIKEIDIQQIDSIHHRPDAVYDGRDGTGIWGYSFSQKSIDLLQHKPLFSVFISAGQFFVLSYNAAFQEDQLREIAEKYAEREDDSWDWRQDIEPHNITIVDLFDD